jgi:predicted ester cyclase
MPKEGKMFHNRLLIVLVALALLVTGVGVQACVPVTAAPAALTAPAAAPATEANMALVRRYVDEVVSGGKFAVLDEIAAPNYKRYLTATTPPINIEAQKKRLAGMRAALPDLTVTIEDMFAEGNFVAYRSTVRGTHQGALLGLAPTGKKATATELGIVRIENGKIIEQWGGADTFDMLQQLGGVVSAAPAKQ